MKNRLFICFLIMIVLYVPLVRQLAGNMQRRPVAARLGYTPSGEVLGLATGDQRYLLSQLVVTKVLFYFGTLVENWRNRIQTPPEFYNMFKTVETAVRLDPYNMDAYYFAQSAFTWEVGRAADVNRLLMYGMRHRDWDWLLPFYAGFNSGYFLKDYRAAGEYFKQAAELSGTPLMANLAARYFYEAGRAEMGLAFLDNMLQQARTPREKNLYEMRRKALFGVLVIEKAVRAYRDACGQLPSSISDLVTDGYIEKFPSDPYGGVFYLDDRGQVRTTSKLAH